MLSGVSVVCFASSYAIAWALELSRLLFRSGVRGAVMLGFAGAGLLAHTAFLYYRAVEAVGSPLSSEKDWYFLAAWALAAVYLYLAFAHPKIPFGLFLLPLSLAMIGAAALLASPQPLAREPASKIWGAVHGLSILAAVVVVLIGFVAGVMYLVQERRLRRHRLPGGRLRLPSQEWLEKANSRAIVLSTLLLGAGIAAGMVMNMINASRAPGAVPWSDPVVLSTWLMFAWMLGSVAFTAAYRPARRGRKVAWLTVASFIFLSIVLAVGLLADSRHWGREERGERREERRAEEAVASGQWLVASDTAEAGGRRAEDTTKTQDPSPKTENRNPKIPKSQNPSPSPSSIPPSALRLPPFRGGRPC